MAASYPQPGRPVELALSAFFQNTQSPVPLYLLEGISPFNRDGVRIDRLDVELKRDKTQLMSAAVVEQAAQGTFMRVILPWMIGQAFEKIGDENFLALMGQQKQMPPLVRDFLSGEFEKNPLFTNPLTKPLARAFIGPPPSPSRRRTWAPASSRRCRTCSPTTS